MVTFTIISLPISHCQTLGCFQLLSFKIVLHIKLLNVYLYAPLLPYNTFLKVASLSKQESTFAS